MHPCGCNPESFALRAGCQAARKRQLSIGPLYKRNGSEPQYICRKNPYGARFLSVGTYGNVRSDGGSVLRILRRQLFFQAISEALWDESHHVQKSAHFLICLIIVSLFYFVTCSAYPRHIGLCWNSSTVFDASRKTSAMWISPVSSSTNRTSHASRGKYSCIRICKSIPMR